MLTHHRLCYICRSPPSFAFIVISPNELRERVLAFTVPDDPKWTRQSVVQLFAKQVAEAAQRMDYVRKMLALEV